VRKKGGKAVRFSLSSSSFHHQTRGEKRREEKREEKERETGAMISSSSSFTATAATARMRENKETRAKSVAVRFSSSPSSFGPRDGDAIVYRFGDDEEDGSSEKEEEKSDEREKPTTTKKRGEKERKTKKKSVCIVGGTGRIGSILTGKILNDPEYEKVHVLTRNLSSEKVKMLKAMAEEGNDDERRLTFAECDVANDTAERLKENVRGYEEVIACFGAQRVSKPFDWITNAENVDERHPKSVNFWGVRKLALAAKEGGCERFVRVTGMSVGYSAFDFIAVLLNNVLSMTIKFQLLGELAIREACTDEEMSYTIVRPGNLRDWEGIDNNSSSSSSSSSSSGSGSTSTSTSSSGSGSSTNSEKVVVLTHGTNHIDASKVSREDVAQVIYLALQNREATENVTLSIAGANKATAGTRSAFRWDPARGAYWETQAIDDANVQILSKWTEADFSKFQPDEKNDLKEKAHQFWAWSFLLSAFGGAYLFVRAIFSLVRFLVLSFSGVVV
jgi:nucleoside-diphosphate-sugar epimerase